MKEFASMHEVTEAGYVYPVMGCTSTTFAVSDGKQIMHIPYDQSPPRIPARVNGTDTVIYELP